jgi:long-chain fatty acid transport protein
MKKIVVMLGVIGLLGALAMPSWAGGILNKSNLSADYFRSLTRHGSTDAADIVAYNPAGVMKMGDGLYTKMDVLYIQKNYENRVPNYLPGTGEDGDFKSDEPSIVPGFFAVYKQDKWAGFFAVTVPGGGGKVKYDHGDARTSILGASFITNPLFGGAYTGIDSMYIEADSYDIGYTLGGAYEINKIFSVAAGLRYIDATQNFKGNVDLTTALPITDVYRVDLKRTATGWGYFAGLDVAPTEKLNIGLLYQSNTALDYRSDVKEDNSPGAAITNGVGWPDGSKEREDLPGIIGLGISFNILPQLRVEYDYTRYLESSAKLEASRFDTIKCDSSEFGLSLTYIFNPRWRASVGYLVTDIAGMVSTDLLPEAPELDARTIGLGAVYSPTQQWQITFGYTNVNYDSVTTDATSSRAPAGSELLKDVWAVSAGVQYRWF